MSYCSFFVYVRCSKKYTQISGNIAETEEVLTFSIKRKFSSTSHKLHKVTVPPRKTVPVSTPAAVNPFDFEFRNTETN